MNPIEFIRNSPYESIGTALPVLPKDILQKIFSEVIREDYRTIRQVSRLWKECADSAWKDSIRDRWVAPGSYKVMTTEAIKCTRQMFSTAEIGDTSIEKRLSLEWYSKLKKVILRDLDLESVTLPDSIEEVTIERSHELTELVLPVEPHRLKSIVLKEVSLEEIDLSPYTNLRIIKIYSKYDCHLILGEHSPEPTVSRNVHVTAKDKRRRT